MDCSTPGYCVLHCLLGFAQIHVHWVGDVISSSAALFFCLQSFPASVFSNELALRIRWPKYWSFSFSISPSNEYSRLTSSRMDWFDLIVIQGTLKSFLLTTVQKYQFFGTQPSLWSNSHICLYMTTGKTITLTIWTFVGKVMSLLFNTLSRFVIAFLPRSMHLNFKAAATVHSDFGAQENKICHCLHFSPF